MTETVKSINPNAESKDYWYQHFQNYKESGLSKTNYASEHKLIKHKFIYWSRKFEIASSNQNSSEGFVAVKMKFEPNKRLNPILCSIWLGDHQLLIHDISALPSIMQLLR